MHNRALLFFLLNTLSPLISAMEENPKKKSFIARSLGVISHPERLWKNKKNLSVDISTALFTQSSFIGEVLDHLSSDFYRKSWRDISRFSRINTTTYAFCHQRESTQKASIRRLALEQNVSDLYIAHQSGCIIIASKIRYLSQIAKSQTKSFSSQDLSDPWYIDATWTSENRFESTGFQSGSLLLVSVANLKVEKTKALLEAGASCSLNPINFLAAFSLEFRDYRKLSADDQQKLLVIIELLLKHGAHPDGRYKITCPTLLHRAVHYNDKNLAQLLLTYGADPYKLFFYLQDHDISFIPKGYELIQQNDVNMQYVSNDNHRPQWNHNAFTLEKGEPK